MVESSEHDQSSQGHGTHLMATHASTGGMRRSSLSRQVDGNNNKNNTSQPTSSSATGAIITTSTPPGPSAPAVMPPQAPVRGTRPATDDKKVLSPTTEGVKMLTSQKRQSGGTTPSTEVSRYVIAVVGHEGVGKTTVIRRAVKSWSGSPAPVTTYTPDGHASEYRTVQYNDRHADGQWFRYSGPTQDREPKPTSVHIPLERSFTVCSLAFPQTSLVHSADCTPTLAQFHRATL